ncbi:MAG: peptidylprolyl isomerase [Saprospiraceae bacterium]|jgi:peptidyl-prolyl cis-trans isomerase B (cyclophilin B)|nr:peptidylprolyl isomerase [Saprospiraceae bacterium]MBL0026596.1 peptidylprolyl isomerase [Saprospiraceae bacterium]
MRILLFLFAFSCLMSCGSDDTYTLETEYGNMTLRIFNSTPKHKDNFKKMVKMRYYDDLLFHRVMKGFMIQGGDPQSKNAAPQEPLGSGGPGYTVPAEIAIPHFKGMIAAARQGDEVNPNKESSGSQFYIVHGSPVTDQELDVMEKSKGFKYSAAQREKYKRLGGAPMLDGEYTVFGEVTSGLDVIDKIATVQTDERDRPIKDIKMKIK